MVGLGRKGTDGKGNLLKMKLTEWLKKQTFITRIGIYTFAIALAYIIGRAISITWKLNKGWFC